MVFGDRQLLPSPIEVFRVLGANLGDFLLKGYRTGRLAAAGLIIAAVLAAGLVMLVAAIPMTRFVVYPISIATKATPAIAFAPLLAVLFASGPVAKIAVAGLIAFFPMVVGGLDGMARAPAGIMAVAASYGPSRLRCLCHAQRGWVLSGFLSGLKTAAPLSVVGAIVGEFVDSTVSGEGGIGLYIATHARNLYMDHVCAGIIIAAGLGLVLFGIASLLDSRHEKWSHLAK
jgi:NitT/TauT family transport system permease protein